MELASSQAYANFRAWVPRNLLPIGHANPNQWLYYDWGPRSYPEPLICFHSLIGSAESFFNQLISLAPLGYRVLSVQIPTYWSVPEFCDALHIFLETLSIRRAHFYGAGLGGFLALHYTARRPERVASLLLTHSFLSTANLNLPIPYSPPVLKWLPEFLVRGTMRAILPKGRTTLQLANAAEFAIGHTMRCPREALASRLALSINSSSVVDRIHVPGERITLIDTIDRTTAALQLSDDTAAALPCSKRALLKQGADFPYLSVPDDVNVHLIVHLRRNAPKVNGPMPIPPPARPRPLPPSVLRRRSEREKRRKRILSREEIENKARLAFGERQNNDIDRFSNEISDLKQVLPERSDQFLAAVVNHCEADIDQALLNVRDGMYDDAFYDNYKEEALKLLIETFSSEARNLNSNDSSVTDQDDSASTQQDDTENVPENTIPTMIADTQGGRNKKPQFVLNSEQRSPIHRQNVHSRSLSEPVHDASEEEQSDGKPISDEYIAEVSPHERDVLDDSDVQEETPDKDGELLQTKLASIDLDDQQLAQDDDTSSTGRESSTEEDVKKSGRSRSRSHRRARTRPYSVDTDALNDYVSSEKVGMRSTGTFVGRGPAPLRTYSESMVTSDWMRAPLPPAPGEEADEDSHGAGGSSVKERVVEGYEPASGASLLDADEDPLQLPAHGSPRSPGDRKRGVFGAKSVPRKYPYENGRGERDPTVLSWKSMFPRPGKSEAAEVSVQVDQSDDMQAPSQGAVFGAEEQRDDWDLHRANDERASSSSEFKPLEALDEENEQNDSELTRDSDEQERLRAWRMSAHEASSIVRR